MDDRYRLRSPLRLLVRTALFHGGETGSIPVGDRLVGRNGRAVKGDRL